MTPEQLTEIFDSYFLVTPIEHFGSDTADLASHLYACINLIESKTITETHDN